jgi:hypothetical protein
MSIYLRGSSLQVLLLTGSLFCTGSAWSNPFAPEGAQGVLEIDVTVDGAGREQAAPGAGWKSQSWSVKHSGTYRLAMVAKSAIIDGEETGSAADDVDDVDREAYWEKKTDDCKGDPNCEMEVAMQQMSDPRVQAQMQQLGDMMSAAQAGAGGAPNAQTWRIASRSGSVRIEQHDDAYGVISETGGGLVDIRCTSSTDQALDPKPPIAAGPVPVVLTIDGNSSNYTLLLPLEDSFMLKRLCTARGESTEDTPRDAAPLLGDRPTGESGWGLVLQIQETYTGGPAAPVFEGRKVIQADVLGAPNRKATVTIVWRFHPSQS